MNERLAGRIENHAIVQMLRRLDSGMVTTRGYGLYELVSIDDSTQGRTSSSRSTPEIRPGRV